MLPPMRPRPIMPICIGVLSFSTTVKPLRYCEWEGAGKVYTAGRSRLCKSPTVEEEESMGKRKIETRCVHAAAAVLLLMAVAWPARGEVAVTAKGGTLGGGVELTVGLTPLLNVRLGGNAFNYTDNDREVSGIFYDATARLRTASALLDLHPGGGGFRLSAGAIYNDTRIDGNSLVPASGSYDIGGVQVPAALVGTLNGQIKFDPVVPYVGLGWGNAVGPGR